MTNNDYRPLSHGRPAHESVTAENAQRLFNDHGVDWPVSGDATTIKRGE